MSARESTTYWDRLSPTHAISRRRLLGGAAAVAGVGAAGVAFTRCGGDGGGKLPTPGGSPRAGSATTPQKGGTFRSGDGIKATYDTFDGDRSRFTPVGVILGYTNQGVLHYKSYADNILEGAFASHWEQPDPLTLNLTLRENLYWHDKSPVNGRFATVDDIVKFITRNREAKLHDGTSDNTFYRKERYADVDSVVAVDSRTVRVRFRRPNALFLATLAAASAKIQAPEAVELFETEYSTPRAEQIIGTGGYELTSFSEEGNWGFRRFDKFYDTAWIDAVEYRPVFTDAAILRASFEQKLVETFTPTTRALADDLKQTYAGEVQALTAYATNPMGGTHYRAAPPWNNENLIGAILRTIDRRQLIADLFQGEAAIAGNIPPAQQAFAIPEKELVTMPGYLANRAEDLAEARKMWEAGGGPALGRVLIDIPDIWEARFSGVSSSILNMFRANLGGAEWEAKIEPYSLINEKVNTHQYGNGRNNIWFGWFSETSVPEPSIDLWTLYNSESSLFSQIGAMKIESVDALTNELLEELDPVRRVDLCRDVERELLSHYGAGISYMLNQRSTVLMWNYYHVGEVAAFGTTHQFATQHWFDRSDPTWQGRPV